MRRARLNYYNIMYSHNILLRKSKFDQEPIAYTQLTVITNTTDITIGTELVGEGLLLKSDG